MNCRTTWVGAAAGGVAECHLQHLTATAGADIDRLTGELMEAILPPARQWSIGGRRCGQQLFVAFATLPLMSGAAFAGNEQEYQGNALPVASTPAAVETNTEASYVPGPAVTLSLSRVATNDTGDERPVVFDGMVASTGRTAFAQKLACQVGVGRARAIAPACGYTGGSTVPGGARFAASTWPASTMARRMVAGRKPVRRRCSRITARRPMARAQAERERCSTATRPRACYTVHTVQPGKATTVNDYLRCLGTGRPF